MSYVGNQKFNWLLLITLLFVIEPFELEAQTKETLQRKIQKSDSERTGSCEFHASA